MEKLELNHIAGYLPYQLESLMNIFGDNETKVIIVGANHSQLELEGIRQTITEFWDYQDVKPILRPLSGLTKEIEVNCEKFVPMERLLDIHTGHSWSFSDYLECQSGKNEWWVKLKGEKPSYFFGYNSEKGFYYLNQFSDNQIVRNQIELFQKLYEWHFDIHDLIGKGLAIDINTLKDEPIH